MESEDNEEDKKINYISKCMEHYFLKNAAIPMELAEVLLSYIFDAANEKILKSKFISGYFNCLHHSMRFTDSTLSEETRLMYLEKVISLPKKHVQSLVLKSRVLQMIAVNSTERRIFLRHIYTADGTYDSDLWTTHLKLFDLFYQTLDNNEVKFESFDMTIRSINNIHMIESKYLSNIVYKTMKYYLDNGRTKQAKSLFHFIE